MQGYTNIDMGVLGVSPSDRYILKSADGLGPTEADVRMSRTRDNVGVFLGRRPQLREIVMRIGLNPEYHNGQTASDLRDEITEIIAPGEDYLDEVSSIRIYKETSQLWGWAEGYFRRVEIVPFAQEPEVQLTMTCTSPYFEGWPVDMNLASVDRFTPNFHNPGSAPTGIRIELTFNAVQQNGWSITRERTGGMLDFANPFDVNDKLIIDTNPGKRTIQRIRGNVTTNLISALREEEEWFMLRPGDNLFATSNGNFAFNSIVLTPRYKGI